jgi:hypothetical protein
MADMIGRGYFVSDVNPTAAGVNLSTLLLGSGSVPGVWGADGKPGNDTGAVMIENPGLAGRVDAPLTLDEEFELRKITGTPYPSRLKTSVTALASNAKNRLLFTTVGWTSEVMGDWNQLNHATVLPAEGNWSLRKADLNYDPAQQVYQALYYGRACPLDDYDNGNTWSGQFAGNVFGFRDGTPGCGIRAVCVNGPGGFTARIASASRQPVLSKLKIMTTAPNGNGGSDWTVQVQVVSPWPNDTALQGAGAGLTTSGMAVEGTVTGATCNVVNLPNPTMQGQPSNFVATLSITGGNTMVLSNHLTSIQLTYSPAGLMSPPGAKINIDQIAGSDIASITTTGVYRPIYIEAEGRGASDPSPVLVVYFGNWQNGLGTGDINTFGLAGKALTSGIPIRFPRSADGSSSDLPPRATAAGRPFKAFARLGDINQVLCFNAAGQGWKTFWPWIPRIAKSSGGADEYNYKFNWVDAVAPGGTNVSRANAANVLTIGGPWKDTFDNDGDGLIDAPADKGAIDAAGTDQGRFGGPELRVAGKVNLNTATAATLAAIETGTGVTGLATQVTTLRAIVGSNPQVPIKSPVLVLSGVTISGTSAAKGPVEQRDEGWCRVSNIAAIRSDTYSIYGTVQYGMIAGSPKQFNIVRSRRFWALVDRSPSLAFPPTAAANVFLRPRILNFQWLN